MARLSPITLKVPLEGTTLHANVTLLPTYQWHFRLWLGIQLMLLAARVLGCGMTIDGLKEIENA